jgi:hypothetical protein
VCCFGILIFNEAMFVVYNEAMFVVYNEAMFVVYNEAMFVVYNEAMFVVYNEAPFVAQWPFSTNFFSAAPVFFFIKIISLRCAAAVWGSAGEKKMRFF